MALEDEIRYDSPSDFNPFIMIDVFFIMGLLVKIFKDTSDSEFKLAQDLVAIAVADGNISDVERQEIEKICQSEGISSETVNDCLLGFAQGAVAHVPIQHRERAGYMSKLVRVMAVDGVSAHMEIYLLQIIASKLGIGYLELVSLVLSTATKKNFPGDIGSRTLSSFISNAIDPKGRPLQKNIDNLRIIFDIMAESVPQLQNAGEDRNAFVHAMASASELLFENTLLNKEFKDMGIDFMRVLSAERERAIKRWTD